MVIENRRLQEIISKTGNVYLEIGASRWNNTSNEIKIISDFQKISSVDHMIVKVGMDLIVT